MEGNQMKMREACKAALSELYKFGQVDDGRIHLSDIVHVANARGELEEALSEPPRNCDVDTPYEQANRMRQFCAKQKRNGIINCGYCPIKHQYQRDCTLAWAQMPYTEEGGAE